MGSRLFLGPSDKPNMIKNLASGASKMVPWVKVLATKPDDLSSVPGTLLIEGEN